MPEIKQLGKINKIFLEQEFGQLQTDDVIVTNERLQHIKNKHPEDYNLFEQYGFACVSEPDFIIKDEKNIGTVFLIKKMPETNLNIIIRLALNTDKTGIKNSVMTFYRLRNRNLNKLIAKNKLLYKKESTAYNRHTMN